MNATGKIIKAGPLQAGFRLFLLPMILRMVTNATMPLI